MTQTSTRKLEAQLTNGSEAVTLARKEAQEIAQKLRARTGGSPSAERIERLLGRSGGTEVRFARREAEAMLEELRESGRRWVFGAASTERPPEPPPGPDPQPLPEPAPPQPPAPDPVLPAPDPEPLPEPDPPQAAPPDPVDPVPPGNDPEPGVPQRSLLARLFSRR